ncbi:MAG: hypothetical protein AAGJ18_09830 [Bacteroidota bacterium]
MTKYKIHSPFVFDFVNNIFEDERYYHFMGVIENYRRNLLGISDQIATTNGFKTVNQLVKSKSISAEVGAILFKTVHEYQPNTILELGTNLGIATLYQATVDSTAKVVTLEEDEQIATKTKAYFKRLGTRNIELVGGNVEQQLPKILKKLETIEHLYFNTFWGTAQTLAYFEQCQPYFVPNTVFVFRAPYANTESLAVWQKLQQHPKVKLSLDVYNLGFLFFRSEQKEVAHYALIESWKKPWMIY